MAVVPLTILQFTRTFSQAHSSHRKKRYLFPGHNTHPIQAPAHHHHRHSSPWSSPRHFPGKPGLAKNKSVNAIKQGTYCLHTVAITHGLLVLLLFFSVNLYSKMLLFIKSCLRKLVPQMLYRVDMVSHSVMGKKDFPNS